MANEPSSNNAMSFILGAVVIAVVGIGVFMWNGGNFPGQHPDKTITIKLPDVKVGN